MADDRRAQILQTAVQMAVERGLDAVTVRGVARRVGIGASTLRHYFPAQDRLHEAVAQELFDTQIDDVRIAESSVDPAERLTECVRQFLPDDDAAVPALETWLTAQVGSLSRARTERPDGVLSAVHERARERVGRWLDVLGAEGALRDLERDRAMTLLFALVDGLCLQLLSRTVTVADAHALLDRVVRDVVVGPSS